MARTAASRSSAARAIVPSERESIPGVRLTPIRQQVLSLLTRLGKSVGGYELLRLYERENGRSSANTIYRTLRYLVSAGLVVHLPSTKTFLARSVSESSEIASAFLVCVDCGAVDETVGGAIVDAVSSAARTTGFYPTRAVEVEGICNRCRQRSAGRSARHRRNADDTSRACRRGELRSHVQ